LRAAAIQIGTEKYKELGDSCEIFVKMIRTDATPKVRLALASALPCFDPVSRWQIGDALAMRVADKDDRFLPKMIWFGLAPLIEKDLPRAFSLAAKTPMTSLADSIYWYAGRTPAGRERIVTVMADSKRSDAELLHDVRLLSFSLSEQASANAPKDWPGAEQRLQKHPDAEARDLAEQLSAVFGDKSVLAKMRTTLADEKAPLPARKTAFELLKRVGDTESSVAFASMLDQAGFRAAIIPLLGRSQDPAVAAALLKRFATFNEADRAAALNTLSGNPVFATELLKAIEARTVDKAAVSSYPVRLMLNLNNADVTARVEKVWGKVTDSPAELKETMAKFKKAYSEAPLWAFDTAAGQKVFEKTCATCHSLNGVGGKIGPDLGGSWRNGLDYFLENVVDPDAVVGENYRLHIIKKNDGAVVSGLFDKETDAAIVIRTPQETISVPKSEIAKHVVSPQSVMPKGLLEALPPREVIEVLKFLTSKR
jgi:putative heme-binding domain-containing protein